MQTLQRDTIKSNQIYIFIEVLHRTIIICIVLVVVYMLYSKPQREIRLYLKRVVSGRTRAIVTLIIFRNDRIGRVKSGHDNKMLRCIIFQENYIFIKLVIIHSS